MFCRINSVTKSTLSVVHRYVDNIVPYIFFVFFTCAVHQHQVAFPSINVLGEKVLADFVYLEKQLKMAKTIADKIDWAMRVKC